MRLFQGYAVFAEGSFLICKKTLRLDSQRNTFFRQKPFFYPAFFLAAFDGPAKLA
jgi:hypothetical protein